MIAAIFAVDEAGGMGLNGMMPWPRNKDDMRWFKGMTQDQIVVMGRKTWDSEDMPTPLPGRLNVVATNNFLPREDILQFRGSVPDAILRIQKSNPERNIFVIGGPHLLMQAKPILEKAYITRIRGEYMCDIKMNVDAFLTDFVMVDEIDHDSCVIEEYSNEAI